MRLPSHHGAASSLTTTTTHQRFLTTRPRRFHGGGSLHRCRSFKVGGQRKRLLSSSAASKGAVLTLRSPPKMASSAAGKKLQKGGVWHFSHGFVFANDTKVVYPQLPSMRHYGTPALAPRDEDESASGSAVGEFQSGVTDAEVAGASEQENSVVESASIGAGTVAVAVSEEIAAAVEAVAGEEEPAETSEPAPSTMPVQPLAFKIPDDVFEAARNAPEGSPQSFWSYNLYRGPAGEDGTPRPKVKVHYCTSEHTTERVLRQYFMDEKLLGFDLEWEISATKAQSVRRNVSLFQLASETRIALFHLALYPKNDSFVAPALREIMENPEITKAGVWIKGDASRVRNFMGVECRGLFELSHLYRLIECSASGGYKKPGKKLVRMATQVEEYLHLPLYKGPDVRTSDWSQALGMDQIICSPLSSPQTTQPVF
ncbi:ribonuclease H-like domain-containing protein [Schizothecium vesticola]|uniref:Ribonuclease H-like domain-containing protein n=1 Tax=Schizothecium vesticola TaxID=314040 RepID=A0AA40KAY9_9PEZI|nr:ribonuclease H-like domain-containing protein [Schizothecium vesticola]